MALLPETRLAHYEIRSLIGKGGMGEVYKAHDSVLGRAVALKVLLAEVVADDTRVQRFMREAKAASALNHPHILTIYQIGQARPEMPAGLAPDTGSELSSQYQTSIHYIAMEFIDGDTLNNKIHRDGLDLATLLRIFGQVADGLAKAHAEGIVHRDLKPDNVMITRDGYAKILDFGLAKLFETEQPEIPDDDMTSVPTQIAPLELSTPGIVFGTVGYMSPEQAQGHAVDWRSDIFSFGCVLYEAVTARRPFKGRSVYETIHKIILEAPPPIKDFNPAAPPELQRIIDGCLAKDPDERYQSMKDISTELRIVRRGLENQSETGLPSPQTQSDNAPTREIGQAIKTGAPQAQTVPLSAHEKVSVPVTSPIKQPGRLKIVIAAAVVIALASIIIFVVYRAGRRDSTIAERKNPSQSAKITRLTASGKVTTAALSPDGKYLFYSASEAGKQSLWLKQVAASGHTQIVTPAEVQYRGITFSPDGEYVFYVSQDKNKTTGDLYQLPVLGGNPPRFLMANVDSAITFSPDGKRFAFVRLNYPSQEETALIVAEANGSGEQVITTRRQPDYLLWPAWSPDGKAIACIARVQTDELYSTLINVSLADKTEAQVSPQRWFRIRQIAWLGDGSGLLITAMDSPTSPSQIWEVPVGGGNPRKVTNDLSHYSSVCLSADSLSLVAVERSQQSNIWSLVAGRENTTARQISSGATSEDGREGLCHAPDGKIVYVSSASGSYEIWIMDADGNNQRQLTFDQAENTQPAISPDGRYIAFVSRRQGSVNIWRMDINGNNPRQLTNGSREYAPSFSPDGRWIVYYGLASGKWTLFKIGVEGGDAIQLTNLTTVSPSVSPDGKLIACLYEENPDYSDKIALIPFEGGPPEKVFDGLPFLVPPLRWRSNGQVLTYILTQDGVSNIWGQPITGGPPKQLTSFNDGQIFDFDWSPDGSRLVCARGQVTSDVILISNFR